MTTLAVEVDALTAALVKAKVEADKVTAIFKDLEASVDPELLAKLKNTKAFTPLKGVGSIEFHPKDPA